MDTYERLQPEDLAQAAIVEAIFVYNTAMRDQMLPRKPLPHPELEEQSTAPLKNVMPGAEAEEKDAKEKLDKEEQQKSQPQPNQPPQSPAMPSAQPPAPQQTPPQPTSPQ